MRKMLKIKMSCDESVVPDWAVPNPGISVWNEVYRFERSRVDGRQTAI